MRIGIDFDNTLVDTKKAAQKYLDIYMPNHDLENYQNLPLPQMIEFFNRYARQITNDSVLYDGVLEAFTYFYEQGIEVFLITARTGPLLMNATQKFLKDNGLAFDGMHFGKYKKGKTCASNLIDLMIDDNDQVLNNVTSYGISVLKFGDDSEYYDCVYNWRDVLEYVERKNNENSRRKRRD